ncbi:glycosyltransferase family 4 protein [Paenibacillus sp. JSM ZJ436]|uniref:glycosyltransferase family 4 protein n=1 Tax=Paenibacillus sp. JSM ZJ436 TaxID=3376190 RepID=UPI0037A9D4CF
MRKVAVITPGSFVIPSARSSSVERVIEQVVPLARQELDIRIYGTGGRGLPLKGYVHGVPCIRLPATSYHKSLVRGLTSWRPEVVEVNNRPFILQKLKARLPGVKMVLNLHSNTFIRPPSLKPGQFEAALGQADRIIVNSRYLKQFIEAGFRRMPPEIVVNHLGVRPEAFTPRFTPAVEALRGLKLAQRGWEGKKILLFVGRLIPEKGVHHIIEALPGIIAVHPDVHVLIIGSAGYSSDRETAYVRRLKQIARPVAPWITFQPFVPFPALAHWYTLGDVMVVPSSTREAFGLVNVEAMATALPIVAAAAGGIPEVVEDGVSGLLIPPENLPWGLVAPINRLLGDESLRASMGAAGLARCHRQFRWDLTAARWAQLMQRV